MINFLRNQNIDFHRDCIIHIPIHNAGGVQFLYVLTNVIKCIFENSFSGTIKQSLSKFKGTEIFKGHFDPLLGFCVSDAVTHSFPLLRAPGYSGSCMHLTSQLVLRFPPLLPPWYRTFPFSHRLLFPNLLSAAHKAFLPTPSLSHLSARAESHQER